MPTDNVNPERFKMLEEALKDQLRARRWVWALNDKPVDINKVSKEEILSALTSRSSVTPEVADGPLWATSGNYDSKKEAYAHCAAAFGVLRLVSLSELELLGMISEISQELEELRSAVDKNTATISEHDSELIEVRREVNYPRRSQ
mgnify:CR=1 FL=1|tara:strand:+ start:1237 stop:1674 length:438 start_codon:yes stop_codon:yes gene_type:complete